MYSFILVLSRILHLALRVFEIMMLLRAILSWIMPSDANAITVFLHNVTEPVLYPIRRFLDRIEFFRACPIDLSFLAVFILLEVLQYMLIGL